MLFTDVRKAVLAWLESTKSKCGSRVIVETALNSDSFLNVFFEASNRIAKLTVAEAGFAPYRYVSFCVADAKQDVNSNPIFCYYDSESSTIPEIIHCLDIGISLL